MNQERRNFWFFSLGRLISLMGSGIQQVAIPLFILDLTGSGTAMGTFVLITNLPRLIFGPFAGVFGDRFDRKKIMVYMDFARGALIILLGFFARFGFLGLTILFIAQFIISTLDILFDPATNAMLADLVPNEKLTKANSIVQGINSFSYIVGPALGGVLYGIFGIEIVFFANGISFAVSGLSEMFILYERTTEKVRVTLRSALKDIKDGLVFLKTINGLIMLLLFAMFSNFLMSSLFSVVMPFFTREVVGFSGEQFGLLQTSYIGGILIGNLVLGIFLSKKKPTRLFAAGIIAEVFLFGLFSAATIPVFVTLLGGSTWYYFAVLASILLVTGSFNALVNTPLLTMFQKKTPTEYRSRVFSVIALLAQLTVPLGGFLFGLALDHIQSHHLILIAAVGNAFVTVLFLALGMTKSLEKIPDKV